MARKKGFNPAIQIAIGFFIVILIGTLLLCLPISNNDGKFLPLIDAFFTSSSAVCVTGLSVFDITYKLSVFGQIVLMLLIQIGGLGFISLTTLFFLILGKKITFEKRLTIKESFNQDSVQGMVKLVKKIIIFVFVTEGIGAVCLMPSFIPLYGAGWGIYKSVFMSISAFCNAGFDVVGNGGPVAQSLGAFSQNIFVLLPIMLLVLVGGLGFIVLFDLPNVFKRKKLATHTKVVLNITLVLVLFASVIFCVFEWNNPNTIGGMSAFYKITNSVFFSITPRTAGFYTVNYSLLKGPSVILTAFYMFLGGSPASTAGGIKITTMFVLILLVLSKTNNKGNLVFRKKTVSTRTIQKSIKVFLLALFVIITSTFLISFVEQLPLHAILFETISATSTVGLSLGITSVIGWFAKLVLAFAMFVGRVGVLTLTLAVVGKEESQAQEIEYPDSKILVG